VTTRKLCDATLGSAVALFAMLAVAGAETVRPNPAAVKDVMAGKRAEANAAWT